MKLQYPFPLGTWSGVIKVINDNGVIEALKRAKNETE